MNKAQYNQELQQELGALAGIEESMPECDRPCNVHGPMAKQRSHERKILALLAQYTGNGMGDDIAKQVEERAAIIAQALAKELAANTPQTKPFTISLPGIDRILTVSKSAFSTWTFRLVLLPLIVYWLANGKIDRETVRDVVAEAVKARERTEQTAVTNATTAWQVVDPFIRNVP